MEKSQIEMDIIPLILGLINVILIIYNFMLSYTLITLTTVFLAFLVILLGIKSIKRKDKYGFYSIILGLIHFFMILFSFIIMPIAMIYFAILIFFIFLFMIFIN